VSTGIELITSLLRGVSKGGVEDGFWDCVVTQGGVWEVLGGTDDRDILVVSMTTSLGMILNDVSTAYRKESNS
jgi:hypothetical protein